MTKISLTNIMKEILGIRQGRQPLCKRLLGDTLFNILFFSNSDKELIDEPFLIVSSSPTIKGDSLYESALQSGTPSVEKSAFSKICSGNYPEVTEHYNTTATFLFTEPYSQAAIECVWHIQYYWTNWLKEKRNQETFIDCAPSFLEDPSVKETPEFCSQLRILSDTRSSLEAKAVFLTALTLMAVTPGYWDKFSLSIIPLYPDIQEELRNYENYWQSDYMKEYMKLQTDYERTCCIDGNAGIAAMLRIVKDAEALNAQGSASKEESGKAYYLVSEAYGWLAEHSKDDMPRFKEYTTKRNERLKKAADRNNGDALAKEGEELLFRFEENHNYNNLKQSCGKYIKKIDLEDNRHMGEAYWKLYLASVEYQYSLPDGYSSDYCLKTAYECGHPDAVRKYKELNMISLICKAEHSGQVTCGICYINEKNRIYEIINKTKPENWELRETGSMEKGTLTFSSEKTYFFLVSEDPDKNLNDYLHVMQVIRDSKDPSACKTELFLRGCQYKISSFSDIESRDMGGNILPTDIFDDSKESATVLARHPLFYPVRDMLMKNRQIPERKCKFNYVIIGNSECCKWLLRDAYWMMTFRNSHIEPHITLIAPDADEIEDEIKCICPHMDNAKRSSPFFNGNEFSDIPQMDFLPLKYNSASLMNKIKEILRVGPSYFSIDIGSDLDNLNLAIRLREETVRIRINGNGTDNDENTGVKELPVITFRCQDPDISMLSRSTVVLSEAAGMAWYNNYNLIPFGSLMEIYGWDSLTDSVLEKISLNAHLQYYLDANNAARDENASIRVQAITEYYVRTYNRDSSMALAMSLPYRICQFRYKNMGPIFPAGWDISDRDAFFSEASRDQIAAVIGNRPETDDIPRDDNHYNPIHTDSEYAETLRMAEWEHERWNRYMISRGWSQADTDKVKKYYDMGNRRQQLFAGKLHPCITEYGKLQKVESDLRKKTGMKRNFRDSDIKSIQNTVPLIKMMWTQEPFRE
ncbi:MAG: hypothetical protein LUF30_08340 [Lachnospiraceae bacterium]|nr:hypothetical protein [Lachnospiraceae bacterium]